MLASINGTTTNYYHEDTLGTVRMVTSSSASSVFKSYYRQYGTTYGTVETSGFKPAFEYTDKPSDPVTGLVYSAGGGTTLHSVGL
jgi:hypothetical protein